MAAVFTALERGDAVDFAAIRVVARPLAPPAVAARPAAPPPATRPLEQGPRDMSRGSPELPAPAPPANAASTSASAASAASTPPAVAVLRDRLRAGPSWSAPTHPPLDHADLTPAQQSLLADAARHAPLPLLRLRGLARGDALDALHDFVTLHRAAGRRYVRVVPGKGLGSRAEPVLKASVLAWCAAEGQAEVDAYAPEPDDAEGTYGALVLRLRPARRGP